MLIAPLAAWLGAVPPGAAFGEASTQETEKCKPGGTAKPQPKFEPRQKFEEEPSAAAAAPVSLPPPGRLDHGFVGPLGTFHLYGWQGDASFLWPTISKAPKLYREPMIYAGTEADGLVFRLSGRFYRVWFKLATKPDAAGKYEVWVRNGERDWARYQLAVVAPHAR
jgi:hypothetical protein